jgi:HAD superfamily hydrolase (TIGR01509 family)
MFKAFFFDLDETLVDSLPIHQKAFRQAFEHLGYDYDEIDHKNKHHDFMGLRIREIAQIMKENAEIPETKLPLETFLRTFDRILLAAIATDLRPLPGAGEALSRAKQQSIVAIVSSGIPEYIQTVLTKFNWGDMVDFVVTGEDVVHGKPNPECFLTAYTKLPPELSITKQQCLVIEDAPNGVKAAKAAGFPVLMVPSLPDQDMNGANWIIPSLQQFHPDLYLI